MVHNDPTGVDQTPRFDLHGGIIGITSGLNIQNGAIVYGYEGDTSITSKRGSAFEFPPPVGFPGFSNEVQGAMAFDLPGPPRVHAEQLASLRDGGGRTRPGRK